MTMDNRISTIIAVCAILLATAVAMFNLMLSLYIIGGVLVFGVGLLIYRIKVGQ